MDEPIDVGGAVSGCSASLRIFGPQLNPDEISAALECQPSRSYRSGDPVSPRVRALRKKGMWLLESPLDRDRQLSEHIKATLAMVSAEPAVWRKLRDEFDVDIYCTLDVAAPNSGLELDQTVISELASRGLALQMDFYVNEQ